MPKKARPHRGDDAPLSDAELKTARKFKDCPPDFIRAVRKAVGRPAGRCKESVHLSLDIDLVRAMRKTGSGWQTRANAILRHAMKLSPVSSTRANT